MDDAEVGWEVGEAEGLSFGTVGLREGELFC